MTMIAQQRRPWQFLPHHPHPPDGEGSRFMLTIDKVHQRRVWDSGNFETPPDPPLLPSSPSPSPPFPSSMLAHQSHVTVQRPLHAEPANGLSKSAHDAARNTPCARMDTRTHAHTNAHTDTHAHGISRWTCIDAYAWRSCGYAWPLVSQAAEHRLHLVSV